MLKKIFSFIDWLFKPSAYDKECAEACKQVQALKIEYVKNPSKELKNEIKRLERLCEQKYTDG